MNRKVISRFATSARVPLGVAICALGFALLFAFAVGTESAIGGLLASIAGVQAVPVLAGLAVAIIWISDARLRFQFAEIDRESRGSDVSRIVFSSNRLAVAIREAVSREARNAPAPAVDKLRLADLNLSTRLLPTPTALRVVG